MHDCTWHLFRIFSFCFILKLSSTCIQFCLSSIENHHLHQHRRPRPRLALLLNISSSSVVWEVQVVIFCLKLPLWTFFIQCSSVIQPFLNSFHSFLVVDYFIPFCHHMNLRVCAFVHSKRPPADKQLFFVSLTAVCCTDTLEKIKYPVNVLIMRSVLDRMEKTIELSLVRAVISSTPTPRRTHIHTSLTQQVKNATLCTIPSYLIAQFHSVVHLFDKKIDGQDRPTLQNVIFYSSTHTHTRLIPGFFHFSAVSCPKGFGFPSVVVNPKR